MPDAYTIIKFINGSSDSITLRGIFTVVLSAACIIGIIILIGAAMNKRKEEKLENLRKLARREELEALEKETSGNTE